MKVYLIRAATIFGDFGIIDIYSTKEGALKKLEEYSNKACVLRGEMFLNITEHTVEET